MQFCCRLLPFIHVPVIRLDALDDIGEDIAGGGWDAYFFAVVGYGAGQAGDLGLALVDYYIALALGNLVDPPATMVNSAGDYVVSFIVSRFVDGKDWLQKKLHPAAVEQSEEPAEE